MSVGGPSALGTLLVQRLDAVLGATVSQQTNIVSGARPDAVTQPDQPPRPEAPQNETQRHPRENVDRTSSQAHQAVRQAIDKSKLDAGLGLFTKPDTPDVSSTASAPTHLGRTAKIILALLARYPGQAPALQGRQPLLQAAALNSGRAEPVPTALGASPSATAPLSKLAPNASGSVTAVSGDASTGIAKALAQALSQTIQGSGLFYESHMASLLAGKYDLAKLLQEPQAQLAAGRESVGSHAPAPTQGEAMSARGDAIPGKAEEAAPQRPEPSGPSNAGSTQASLQASVHPANPAPAGLHPDTHLLVRQQLETMANQAVVWRGDAWPDAPMQWEVQRHADQLDADAEPQETWSTRIRIVLPQLGEVEARLTLAGQQVLMRIEAPSAKLLDERADSLRAACAASGLQLTQLAIHTAPPDNENGQPT